MGGIDTDVSPKAVLAVGLKVDADALPQELVEQLKNGEVNLDDPATTVALLKLNAVVGVKGSSTRRKTSSRLALGALSATPR